MYFFFLYVYSIYIPDADRHDTDTGQSPASGFHFFFAEALHEVRPHERRGAGDPLKAYHSHLHMPSRKRDISS